MADFPALPVFTDAYLADTRHLTTEEHGAYLLLLMEAWRRPDCNLPDDDNLLSRLCGLPLARWQEVKATILAFWVRDGRRKTWTQKRLLKERSYVAQKSASRRDSAAKRWNKTKNGDANAMQSDCKTDAPTPTPTPTLKEREPNGSSKKIGSRISPDWTLPSEWREWAIGQGMSASAVVSQADRFRDYWLGKSGKDATKTDWQATWRNWVRKAMEDRSAAPKVSDQPRHGDERVFPDGTTRVFDQFMGWKIVH